MVQDAQVGRGQQEDLVVVGEYQGIADAVAIGIACQPHFLQSVPVSRFRRGPPGTGA